MRQFKPGQLQTGSLYNISSSYALTASYTTNIPLTASYAINAETASYVNPLRQNVQITGSLYFPDNTHSIYFSGSGAASRLTWNDTDGTLELGLKGGIVQTEIGQGLVTRVVNKTTPNIDLSASNYQVVVVSGAQGQRLAVKLAQADNDANSAGTLGIIAEDIAKNQEGFIITVGLLKNRNTTGALQGETWSDGDILYLSPITPGAITNIKPQAPQHTVIVGYVEYAHANNGKIYVKIDNGYELDELHNVRITTSSLSSGDLLVYSGSVWANTKQLTGSYGLTGSLTATTITASNAQITGNVQILGTASISVLNVTYESASIIYSSGSNQFGDAANDTQTLWGTVDVKTGPLLVTGSVQSTGGFTGSFSGSVAAPGSTTQVVYNNGGVLGADSGFVYSGSNVGIGSTVNSFSNLSISKNMTGGLSVDGIRISSTIQSGSSQAQNFLSFPSTQATTFTLFNLYHFYALQGSFGAGSTVNRQTGFFVGANLIGATTNIGFLGSIPSGANRWNLYMDGTAINSLQGDTGIGFLTTPSARFQVRGSGATSATSALRIENSNASASLAITDDGASTFTAQSNATPITITGYVATGSAAQPALDITGSWNTSGTPTLIRVNITDTSSNNSSLLMDLRRDGTSMFNVGKGGIARGTFYNGGSETSNTLNAGFARSGGNTTTSGTQRAFVSNMAVVPTTGTAVFNQFEYVGTIIQTGGANGITRGFYANPTLTAAADWRSIEWSNNTGFGLYGAGGATNYLSGSLGIGTSTPTASLHISGASSAALLRIDSPAVNNILYVSGSGQIGFNQTSSTAQVTFKSLINSDVSEINTSDNGAYGFRSSGIFKGSSWFFYGSAGSIANASGVSMLYFDSSRNVGLNVSSSLTSRFQVRGSGTTSGTTALRVENANASASLVVLDNGNVGIGTTTPSSLLSIYSGSSGLDFNPNTNTISSTSTEFRLFANGQNVFRGLDNWTGTWSDAAVTSYFQTGRSGGNTAFSTLSGVLYNRVAFLTSRFQITNIGSGVTPPTNYFQIDDNNTNLFSVTTTGRVGINNITPSASLHISGAASSTLLIVSSSAATALFVSGSGNVGIGTNTPGMSLSVVGNAQFGFTSTSAGARLHTRGAGTTSTSTSFRADNANQLPALRITDDLSARFDGKVSIGSGNFPTASLDVAGTTRISGSFNTAASGSILTVIGSGSAQPIFTVQGSQGELFSITDSLSGSLFSVNDISGLPILEVFSDNTTLIGNYQDPMLITTAKVVQTNSGSFTVYSLPTASYDTAFFEYSIKSGSNARAGTIMAMQLGSTVNFTETTTTDFGDTTAISFTVIVTGSNMALTGSSTTGSWTTKCIVRGL